MSPPLERLGDEILDYRALDGDAPHHFLGPSPRTAPSPEMTAYARELLSPGMTAAAAVEAIGLALHRDMKFDPDATTVDTPRRAAPIAARACWPSFSCVAGSWADLVASPAACWACSAAAAAASLARLMKLTSRSLAFAGWRDH